MSAREIKVARDVRRKIFDRTTGRTRYFYNTDEGMVRACAYWLIMRPKDIQKLYISSQKRFKGFRVDGSTRIETLAKLVMVSSLGFRVRVDNLEGPLYIIDPPEDGMQKFWTNYIIAQDAIAKEGGPESIDNHKLVMWKHRTYFQAMSTLQLYAANFRTLTKGLEEVPDIPGWLLTGMENMRKGIETVSAQKAIQVAVGTCDKELEAEKRGYEEELRNRDKQIDALTQTVADMTRRDQMVAEELRRATPAGPPPLPPRDRPPTPPPRAPEAPKILARNISTGRAAVKQSVSDQKTDENASQRVQSKGARSASAFLVEVRRGINLKKPASPATTPKADKISHTLVDTLGAAMDARRAQIAQEGDDDDEEDWEYGGKRAGVEIGAMFYPLSSPRVRGGNRWRNKMNDVFTTLTKRGGFFKPIKPFCSLFLLRRG